MIYERIAALTAVALLVATCLAGTATIWFSQSHFGAGTGAQVDRSQKSDRLDYVSSESRVRAAFIKLTGPARKQASAASPGET